MACGVRGVDVHDAADMAGIMAAYRPKNFIVASGADDVSSEYQVWRTPGFIPVSDYLALEGQHPNPIHAFYRTRVKHSRL